MKDIYSPTLIIHGGNDTVISFAHGQHLYALLRPDAKLKPLWLPDAGHNDIECFPQYLHRLYYFFTIDLGFHLSLPCLLQHPYLVVTDNDGHSSMSSNHIVSIGSSINSVTSSICSTYSGREIVNEMIRRKEELPIGFFRAPRSNLPCE